MEHTIIVNNKSYDLPKKTITVTEKLDKAMKVDSVKGLTIRKKYELLHETIKGFVGEENAAEMFGTANLDEIDLSELAVVVLSINDAYEKPMNDYQTDRMRERIGSIPLEKIASITKTAQAVSNMQVMKQC